MNPLAIRVQVIEEILDLVAISLLGFARNPKRHLVGNNVFSR
jgi:hypothetical protein